MALLFSLLLAIRDEAFLARSSGKLQQKAATRSLIRDRLIAAIVK